MLDSSFIDEYKGYVDDIGVSMSAYKKVDLSFEDVNSRIHYNSETGKFTWLVDIAKNVKAGSEAGTFKGTRLNIRTGKYTRYMYIRLLDSETPAARVAWLLHKGEWPAGNVGFKDNDPSNLKFDNLVLAMFPSEKVERDGLKKHKMSKDAQRHYGLRRYYGMTIQEYADKHTAQDGVCAICKGPETAKMHGKIKPLSVDHEHGTGRIRGLLCTQCNYMIGHCREDRNILLAGVRYLDSYSDKENVISLVEKT
jgi:hypothetical protein